MADAKKLSVRDSLGLDAISKPFAEHAFFDLKRRPLSERLKLAGCTDEEIRLLKSAGELLESLKSLVEWAKEAEVSFDFERGDARTREEIESAEDWCFEIRYAEAVIAEVEKG